MQAHIAANTMATVEHAAFVTRAVSNSSNSNSNSADRPATHRSRLSLSISTSKSAPQSGQLRDDQGNEISHTERDSTQKGFRRSLRLSARLSGSRRSSLKASLSNSVTSSAVDAEQQEGSVSPSEDNTDDLTVSNEWRVLRDGRRLSNDQYLSITAPLIQANWQSKLNPEQHGVATMMVGALSKVRQTVLCY